MMDRICDLATQLEEGITNSDINFLEYLADNPEVLKRVSTYRLLRKEDKFKYYWTTVHLAAWHGRRDMLEIFNRVGCPLENPDERKRPPVWYAAGNGHMSTLEFLVLECAVKFKYGDVDGWSPMHAACRYGKLDVVKFLVAQDCPINHTDCLGWSPLHKAIWGDHLDVCKYLIRQGASANSATFNDMITPLHLACYRLNHEGVKLFLSKSTDISHCSSKGVTSLMIVCQLGSFDLAEYLIFSGASVNERTILNSAPIHYAAENGHSDIVAMLINKGANPNETNKRGWSPFLLAARYGHERVCRCLHIKGANPRSVHQTKNRGAVHLAALSGDLETLTFLIKDLELNFDDPDKDGLTPLHLCAIRGFSDCVDALILYGASVDCLDKQGRSAVHLATSVGRMSLAHQLIAQGGSFWHALTSLCRVWKLKYN